MRAIEAEQRLAVLASGQWGLVTAPQATAEGVSHSQLNRLADREVIARLAHGVYRLRSAPLDRHLDLRAAWLAVDPKRTAGQRLQSPSTDAVVSHASAAMFRGWGDLTAYDHEFTFDGRKQSRRTDVRFHRGPTPTADVEIIDGLPVTTAERLVADLLAGDFDFDHVGAVFAGAIYDRAIDVDSLPDRIATFAARRGFGNGDGVQLVAGLLESGDAKPEAAANTLARLARGPGPVFLDTTTLVNFSRAIDLLASPNVDPAAWNEEMMKAFARSLQVLATPAFDPKRWNEATLKNFAHMLQTVATTAFRPPPRSDGAAKFDVGDSE